MTGTIRERNRILILKAAEQVFADRGFEGATTTAIASRAGLPKSNLHYYFGTKLDLYRGILEDILRTWLSAFERFDENDDPATALTSYIADKIALSFARPCASRIFAREMLSGAPHLQDFLTNDLRHWVDERTTVLQAWIAQGRMHPVDPHHLLFTIWAATQTYADFAPQIRAIEGRDPDSAAQAEIARSIAAIVVRAAIPSADNAAERNVFPNRSPAAVSPCPLSPNRPAACSPPR